MLKKSIALMLGLLFAIVPPATAAGRSGANTAVQAVKSTAGDATQSVVKDETVYVGLSADGTPESISVVNRIETPRSGAYTDYGTYTSVINLTDDAAFTVQGDAITWQLTEDKRGFYYQGDLTDGEPPFLFSIRYFLNGAETSPQAMAGAAGDVRIRLTAKPNESADPYFTRNCFCQVQAALNLDDCRSVSAPGATPMLTGRTMNLAFTLLPGKSAEYEIGFETDAFSFDGFTMTAMPFDQKSLTGIDTGNLKEDIRTMSDGTQELVEGTRELKDGLGKLSDGVSDMASGAAGAKKGVARIKTGVQEYTAGVAALAVNARQLAQGLQQLAQNGQGLSAGYGELSAGVDAVLAQLTPAAPPELAGEITVLRARLAAYKQGLDSYVSGVADLSAGMTYFADGLEQLGNAGPELVSGLTTVLKGMTQLADGLAEMADKMNDLPGELDKLIDGQSELKEGVDEAAGVFDEWDFGADPAAAPVSFVSPKNKPRSVQFVYRTEEIGEGGEDVQPSEPAREEKGFFEKLMDLFR